MVNVFTAVEVEDEIVKAIKRLAKRFGISKDEIAKHIVKYLVEEYITE